MIDVKKLSIGFLILVVAGGTSALFISNTGAFSGSNSGAIVADSAGGGSDTPSSTLTGNAFAAQTANDQDADGVQLFGDDPLDGTLSATTTAAMIDDPTNLTDMLANAYMSNLMATNPNGPVADASGDQTLTPPDATSVIEQFLSSSTSLQAPAIPDWDAEAAEIPIIITSSTPAALSSYGTALDSILQQNVVQTDLSSALDNNSDPSVIPFTATDVDKTLQDVSNLQTPASAVNLQKSLVKTLVYAKNLLALVQNGQTDPVKTELIMEAEDTKYATAVQNLQTDITTAQSENLFSDATTPAGPPEVTADTNQGGVLAFIQSIAGVPTAHAQFFGLSIVHDPINDIGIWATVAQLVENNLQNIALQLIKNALVFIMQKTIIAGIQNSGAPRFIQQWGTTLANAFTQSALNTLNNQLECVAGAPFSAQLRLTLAATYKPGNNNVCAVQYQSQLGNTLTNFYNNFANGGWITFGSTMQPDNDYYGSAFFIAQAVGNTAQNAQNAASAKAVASQGFNGTAVCSDGSSPDGNSVICSDASGNWTSHSGSTCPNNTTFVELVPNNGFCTNGQEPSVQTPGTILNSMVNSAVAGNFQLVTSANSWEGLASGLFISILQQTMNSLAQTAIAGENGLLQQAYNGGGANSVNSNGAITAPAASTQPITCYISADPSGNPLMADILLSGGETISANGATTPSYTWTPPTGATLSVTTGASAVATFTTAGTYGIFVQESPDNSSTTCSVTVPAPSQ